MIAEAEEAEWELLLLRKLTGECGAEALVVGVLFRMRTLDCTRFCVKICQSSDFGILHLVNCRGI